MVALTFPDGARRDYANGTTGLDIAKGISPSLAKRTVAMALDGAVADLADTIERDAKIDVVHRHPQAMASISMRKSGPYSFDTSTKVTAGAAGGLTVAKNRLRASRYAPRLSMSRRKTVSFTRLAAVQ